MGGRDTVAERWNRLAEKTENQHLKLARPLLTEMHKV